MVVTVNQEVHEVLPEAGFRVPHYYEHARSYNRDTGVFQPYRRAVVDALPLRPGTSSSRTP